MMNTSQLLLSGGSIQWVGFKWVTCNLLQDACTSKKRNLPTKYIPETLNPTPSETLNPEPYVQVQRFKGREPRRNKTYRAEDCY